jgi:hypothetical protein
MCADLCVAVLSGLDSLLGNVDAPVADLIQWTVMGCSLPSTSPTKMLSYNFAVSVLAMKVFSVTVAVLVSAGRLHSFFCFFWYLLIHGLSVSVATALLFEFMVWVGRIKWIDRDRILDTARLSQTMVTERDTAP